METDNVVKTNNCDSENSQCADGSPFGRLINTNFTETSTVKKNNNKKRTRPFTVFCNLGDMDAMFFKVTNV